MLDIPPELDFTSEHFDPSKALTAKHIYLPYPKAKTYNNLADWYSHTFKKKESIAPNQESQKASKNECFVLKRNYEWYYKTLGLDLPADFDIQSRNQKYTKRKRNSNGKYQVDKKVIVREMPSEMLQPIRSSKILVKKSDGYLKDCIFVNADSKISNCKAKERNISSEVKSCVNGKYNLKNATSDSAPKHFDIVNSENVTPPNLINKETVLESKNCDNASKKLCSKSSVSSLPTVLQNLENKNSIKDDTLVLAMTPNNVVKEKVDTEFRKCDIFQNEQISEISQHSNLETSLTMLNEKSNIELKKHDCVQRDVNTVNSLEETSARKTGIKGDNFQSCFNATPRLSGISQDVESKRHGSVSKSICVINSDNNALEKPTIPVSVLDKKALQKGKKQNISLNSVENVSVSSAKTSVLLNKKSTLKIKKCYRNVRKKIGSSNCINTTSLLPTKPVGFEKKDCDIRFNKLNSNQNKIENDKSPTLVKVLKELNKESGLEIRGNIKKKVNLISNSSLPVNLHKIEEKLAIENGQNLKSNSMQEEINSAKSIQDGSVPLVILPEVGNKQLNKLDVSQKEASATCSVNHDSSLITLNNILTEKPGLESCSFQKVSHCANFVNDCSAASETIQRKQIKSSEEFAEYDNNAKEIRSNNHAHKNLDVLQTYGVQNEKHDLKMKKDDNRKEVNCNSVNDVPSCKFQINFSDLKFRKHDRSQKEICSSKSINDNLFVQNEKLSNIIDFAQEKNVSVSSLDKKVCNEKADFNADNNYIQKEIDHTSLFSKSLTSVPITKAQNKKSDLQVKSGSISKQSFMYHSKDYLPLSVSPLKDQNQKIDVGSKKCNSPQKETNAPNSINTLSASSPQLKDKENAKELALLALARKARKRLHIKIQCNIAKHSL